jgi:hypothetical protein
MPALLRTSLSKAASSAVCWEWLRPVSASRSFLKWRLTATLAAVTCGSVTLRLRALSLPLWSADVASTASNALLCLNLEVEQWKPAPEKRLRRIVTRQANKSCGCFPRYRNPAPALRRERSPLNFRPAQLLPSPRAQRTMVYVLCCSILPVMLLAPLRRGIVRLETARGGLIDG